MASEFKLENMIETSQVVSNLATDQISQVNFQNIFFFIKILYFNYL